MTTERGHGPGQSHVVEVLEDEDRWRAIDIIAVEIAGSRVYTFAEYRRDPEDPRGWRPVADVPLLDRPRYGSLADARSAAYASVGWIDER